MCMEFCLFYVTVFYKLVARSVAAFDSCAEDVLFQKGMFMLRKTFFFCEMKQVGERKRELCSVEVAVPL